ncbi:MAG: ATP-binding cassette domain-containing protein [Rhodovarius sp.]|nr:ATP-binding cassette domain-containing protein [Rhodovarius sp.]MCX7933365.1 ATP-binding cassette domain-containing protein [Rhodovarius sp.]MDW8313815.1 ATP-binding cassette domain-containing protein [Rhodovarius sp.]
MVRLEQVTLRYRAGEAPALSEIDLELAPGSFTWLTGPSGAGKTSLLSLLHLSLRPSEGRLFVLGCPIHRARRRELPGLRRRIGVIFQDLRLLPHLDVLDNVALPLRIAGRREAQIDADAREILAWVGLAHRLHDRPEALSGGEQQRVALARAVIARPALLLADEPTAQLDEAQARRVIALLREMHRLGSTVVVATHSSSLPAEFPAPILRLEGGRVVAHG